MSILGMRKEHFNFCKFTSLPRAWLFNREDDLGYLPAFTVFSILAQPPFALLSPLISKSNPQCSFCVCVYILSTLPCSYPTCISHDIGRIWSNEEYVWEVCIHIRIYMMIYMLGMWPYMEYMDILILYIKV